MRTDPESLMPPGPLEQPAWRGKRMEMMSGFKFPKPIFGNIRSKKPALRKEGRVKWWNEVAWVRR